MEITCYRDAELHRDSRLLPAAVYNTAHVLLEHSNEGVVFVPIRGMQFLAVIDREEIVFLDAEHKSLVDIAWQNFRPQQRSALTEPVPYEAVFYNHNAKETMQRLLVEFPPALTMLSARDTPSSTARIIKLERSKTAS
ncbi:MAG: hypothetical protein ACOY9D_06730 [Pseudomonadota bacterium]